MRGPKIAIDKFGLFSIFLAASKKIVVWPLLVDFGSFWVLFGSKHARGPTNPGSFPLFCAKSSFLYKIAEFKFVLKYSKYSNNQTKMTDNKIPKNIAKILQN